MNFEFSIPFDSYIELEIYDSSGAMIRKIKDGIVKQGLHQVSLDTESLSSGLYFLRYSSGDKIILKNFLISK
jgi:flagellar hook assembly protein FlgD